MQVEEAIRSHLEAQAAIAALVRTRVFVEMLPQSVRYPAIRVKLVSDPKEHGLRGLITPTRSRIQVDSYQDEASEDAYGTANRVAEAVFDAIDGKRFTIGDGSPPDLIVTAAIEVDRRSLTEQARDLQLVRISQDFYVWSKPA